MALTKTLESERGRHTGNTRFAGSWRKGQFSRLLLSLPSVSAGYPATQWRCTHIYHVFADTITRKPRADRRTDERRVPLFVPAVWTDDGVRREEENLEKYHGHEIKRNGRFSSPCPYLPSPDRRKRQTMPGGWKSDRTRGEDISQTERKEAGRERERERERGVFNL